MTLFITIVHITVCLALIGIVLLQQGKGADIGATFGGGASQTVFGGRGAGSFLTKLTTGAAIVFMLTSLTLSYFSAPTSVTDLLEELPAEGAIAPVEEELEESTFPEPTPLGDEGEVPSGFEAIPPPTAGGESDALEAEPSPDE